MRSDEIEKGMSINDMKPYRLIFAAIIMCAMLLFGNNVVISQENVHPNSPENSEQQPPSPQKEESIKGYPIRERQMGGPTDVERDLDNSFPKRDSVLELILRCRESQRQ
jgi:hypothetical protein